MINKISLILILIYTSFLTGCFSSEACRNDLNNLIKTKAMIEEMGNSFEYGEMPLALESSIDLNLFSPRITCGSGAFEALKVYKEKLKAFSITKGRPLVKNSTPDVREMTLKHYIEELNEAQANLDAEIVKLKRRSY